MSNILLENRVLLTELKLLLLVQGLNFQWLIPVLEPTYRCYSLEVVVESTFQPLSP